MIAIAAVLFQALMDVTNLKLPVGIPSSGKRFEDFMVQQLCETLQQQGGLAVFPPRYTLREATLSSLAHQFDIVIQRSGLIAVECKFRRTTSIAQLFAFVGKLIDYRQPPSGIFVTTAENVNDEVFCYSIAHDILLVCSCLPPVQYMMRRVKRGTDLQRRLTSLQTRLRGEHPPRHLLIEWKNAYERFLGEGYS